MIVSDLVFWGCFGMGCEVGFTGLLGLLRKKQLNLMGHVSLWMFPIYAFGLTAGFDLIAYLIPIDWLRWLTYPFWIWLVEFAVGFPMSRLGVWIWDYRDQPEWAHWEGVISWLHFPIWIGFGLVVEILRGIG